ncbi:MULTISPECIES: amino acid ABC transporter permease [unclassified Achromobacter]|uniref:amino acid ABC transporter permease n=1 Tax=unclassified Achromobacter TaxID=2626865 RepID=UPI000B5172D6|nr:MULTISPECIES: amino acid ABC transporter permease [unclassified Achromobacter]OWT71525.1 polar amino acid ABC transporter permease [Achromobacter sp. HZ34]OWT73182.1 polar amino acid ABC transporter permease [Achromobacter sp. HZ28]
MDSSIVDVFLNWEVIHRYLPDILESLVVTIALSVLIVIGGLVLGAVLAVARAAGNRLLAVLIVIYVDVWRTIPPMVYLIVVFFCAPYLGLTLSPFASTWITLTLILAAFIEECVWVGILAVPKGQVEAARSTGMSWLKTMLHVVLPQAVRMMIGPITGKIAAITKETALGSVIGLTEILGVSESASSNSGNPSTLSVAVVLYLAIFLPVVMGSRYLERTWNWRK